MNDYILYKGELDVAAEFRGMDKSDISTRLLEEYPDVIADEAMLNIGLDAIVRVVQEICRVRK